MVAEIGAAALLFLGQLGAFMFASFLVIYALSSVRGYL